MGQRLHVAERDRSTVLFVGSSEVAKRPSQAPLVGEIEPIAHMIVMRSPSMPPGMNCKVTPVTSQTENSPAHSFSSTRNQKITILFFLVRTQYEEPTEFTRQPLGKFRPESVLHSSIQHRRSSSDPGCPRVRDNFRTWRGMKGKGVPIFPVL